MKWVDLFGIDPTYTSNANYIEERIYLPKGMDADDTERHSFQAVVQYRGRSKWAVVGQREAHEQFSTAGRWLYLPLKMTAIRWCRYDTFDDACVAAEKACELRTLMGMTYPEVVEWRKTR